MTDQRADTPADNHAAHNANSPSNPSTPTQPHDAASPHPARRSFLHAAGAGIAASLASGAAFAAGTPSTQANQVTLPAIADPKTDAPVAPPDANAAPDQRIGFAVVGLGHLAVNEILPAIGQCKYAKVTALVSGDPIKAQKLATQYGVKTSAIYDYSRYDELANNPEVHVIYIVLPNAMHKEYVLRGAQAGKHILCEKPMATSVADCEAMIDACRRAQRKLMIGYRSQYEPVDREIVKRVRAKQLGQLTEFVACNAQTTGDPSQWRLNLKMAGGGALPDIGLYCLNASRFLSDEEPYEVTATITQNRSDPRYREVESAVHFILKFPSGFTATCMANYSSHESRFYRLMGTTGWIEESPAFAYEGLMMRYGTVIDKQDVIIQPTLPPVNQFAREMDHMALCVMQDRTPHTPGEEGLQDQKIMEAIYLSARTGKAVSLSPPASPTRGPDPEEEHF